MDMTTLKILFVSANPLRGAALKVESEYKKVRARLSGKANWDIRHTPSATLEEVIDEIAEYKPLIVHFSAHGSLSEEIILNDEDGTPKPVPTKALEQLFKTMKGNIRVVVMNSCFSARQARAIAGFVDCVVGVKLKLIDDVGIKFSPRFYEELAKGKSVSAAYDMAMISVYGERPESGEIPRLFRGKVLPETVVLVNVRRRPDGRNHGGAKRNIGNKTVPRMNSAIAPQTAFHFSVPEGWTFRAVADQLVRNDGSVITYEGFTSRELRSPLKPWEIKVRTPSQALERLRSITDAPDAIRKYAVLHKDSAYTLKIK